jgi:predicted nucleic acid-binding protein
MRINRIVVNASPIICLLKSDLLYLLPELFSEIMIPDKVYQEITVKSGLDISSLKYLKKASDITVPQNVIAWDMGDGESSVLAFAQKNPDCWAVIDDREARRCASALGCRYIGTIGIILLAKKRGIIKSVRDSITKLQNAGLWLSESFISEVCKQAGE